MSQSSALLSEVLPSLVEKCRDSGVLKVDDLVRALEDIELTPALIDQVVQTLKLEGIELEKDFEVPAVEREFAPSPTSLAGSLTDPVKAYMQAIGSIEQLTGEDERHLAELMREGQIATSKLLEMSRQFPEPSSTEKAPLKAAMEKGTEARRRLVEANLRLVVSIAKRYRHRGISFLDLIQEGNAGLVRAVEKFDPSRGFKLSTYATWWIRQSMSRAIADQARTIRIPVHVYEALDRVLRVQRSMLQEHGQEPTIEELANKLQLPVERVREILSIDRSTVSLEPQGSESGLSDVIADSQMQSPDAAAGHAALTATLTEAMEELNEREKRLMSLRFGLEDGQSRRLEEVGQMFGVSRERVRQIEARTLAKLRTPLERKQIEEFLVD